MMKTALKNESNTFTTPEERARELLFNAFGCEVVMRGNTVSADLSQGLAEALRTLAAEEKEEAGEREARAAA